MALSPVCTCLSCPTRVTSAGEVICGVYPSTITDRQWQVLAPLLPPGKFGTSNGGRREKHCRRRILDAIFYLIRGGLAWRQVPVEFPPWQTVYGWFARWHTDGTWQRIHDALRDQVRIAAARNATPSAAILDTQSVRAAATVGKASRGYDGGKRVNGRKRHIAVDALGLLLVVLVTAAGVQDRDGAHRLLALLRERFATIRHVWADGGYAGRLVTWAGKVCKLTVEIVKRNDTLAGFVVVPRRWVVERTFAWLFTCRRLVHDYERRPEHHEAMVTISMIMLMSRRLAQTQTT